MKRQKGIFSEARFKVLQTLYFDSDGVSLREIAYRSGVAPHGVQVATRSLLTFGLIKKRKVKQRVVFFINPMHFEYSAIEAMINALKVAKIKECAELDSRRNINIFTALDDLRDFSSKVKGSK